MDPSHSSPAVAMRVSPDRLAAAIQKVMGVSIRQMQGPVKIRKFANARRAFCRILRDNSVLTTEEISAHINRHHTTLTYHMCVSADLMKTDPHYRALLSHITDEATAPVNELEGVTA